MQAVQLALESPLLDSSSIRGTKDILLNIISGTEEITMGEIGEIIDYLQEEAGMDATIIWGNGTDHKLGNQISVTIIATGFDVNPNKLYQDPAEIIEFSPDDSGFEINLNDENLFESVSASAPIAEPKRETIKQPLIRMESPKKKLKKSKNRVGSESNPENANVDSWFTRQFTKFFEDKDTPISEENNQ